MSARDEESTCREPSFASMVLTQLLTNFQDLDILMTVAGYPVLRKVDRDTLRYQPAGIPPPKGDHAKL
jgi:hypothetical protein